MTDQWGPSGDGSEWARPDTQPDRPAPPTAPLAPIEPTLTLESEQPVQKRPGIGGSRVVAGIVGVLVLLGGAVFAVTQLGSSGPGSAEDAVRELLDAASDEDVLGLLAALDPGEREALRGPVEDLFAELERLEVFSDDFRLDGIAGIDIEFEDVELRSEPVRDDLVRVYFTGGRVTAGVDGDEIPLGEFVHDTLEALEVDPSGLQESDTSEITDDGTFVVARDSGDGWRVSIGYTAAEYARLGAGVPMPATGITPVGADSPEAAVEGLFRAVAAFDLEAAIARLSPGELAALHDYAPLFLDEAQRALDDATSDVEVSIDELELRSDTNGDRARVFVDSFAVTVEVDGESGSFAVRDGCFEVSGPLVDDELADTPFEDGPVCPDELAESYDEVLEGSGFDTDELEMPELPPFRTPEIGISTARVGGEWYVAPFATALDAAVEGLRSVEREHLEGVRDFVESFLFGFGGVTEFEEFDDIGDALGDEFYEAPDGFEDDFGEGFDEELGADDDFGTFYDPALLEEMALDLAGGDTDTAACIWDTLVGQYDEFTVYEVVDAWEFDYVPTDEAQAALDAALRGCEVA